MTVNLNLAGLPAVCLPCGFAEQPGGVKLPVGMQVGAAGLCFVLPYLGERQLQQPAIS